MVERGSQGKGDAITLDAQTIELKGGIIRGSTRSGAGGDITIRANRLDLDGQQQSSNVITGIRASSRETAIGRGGNIKLELQDLQVRNGSGIRTGTYGIGDAGNIIIQSNTIALLGIDPVAYSSGIFTTVNRPTATGKGGNIQITSDRVTVLDSAFISASTLGIGNSGDLSITSNLVEVAGVSPDPARTVAFVYGIVSSINVGSKTAASAGRLSITANQLIVRDRGLISVGNSGSFDRSLRQRVISPPVLNLGLSHSLISRSSYGRTCPNPQGTSRNRSPLRPVASVSEVGPIPSRISAAVQQRVETLISMLRSSSGLKIVTSSPTLSKAGAATFKLKPMHC